MSFGNRPYNPDLTQNIDVEDLPRYLFEELVKLSAAMEEMRVAMYPDELHVEPARKINNMVVLADGSDWNPGSGKGLYRWNADVSPSAWVFIG